MFDQTTWTQAGEMLHQRLSQMHRLAESAELATRRWFEPFTFDLAATSLQPATPPAASAASESKPQRMPPSNRMRTLAAKIAKNVSVPVAPRMSFPSDALWFVSWWEGRRWRPVIEHLFREGLPPGAPAVILLNRLGQELGPSGSESPFSFCPFAEAMRAASVGMEAASTNFLFEGMPPVTEGFSLAMRRLRPDWNDATNHLPPLWELADYLMRSSELFGGTRPRKPVSPDDMLSYFAEALPQGRFWLLDEDGRHTVIVVDPSDATKKYVITDENAWEWMCGVCEAKGKFFSDEHLEPSQLRRRKGVEAVASTLLVGSPGQGYRLKSEDYTYLGRGTSEEMERCLVLETKRGRKPARRVDPSPE